MNSEIVLTSILLGSQDNIKSRKVLKGSFVLEEGQMDIYEIRKINAAICDVNDYEDEGTYYASGKVKVTMDYLVEKDCDNVESITYYLPFFLNREDKLEELQLERLSINVLFPRSLEIEAYVISCSCK
ncbi:hypothetical protein [Pseudobacteroides cellulosolvens]|uniref:Uncharacterized protein n=1 Tax=Pseudobacteroides cellulosolvens ATCC 35603 = DSM 2933 TaxID=398512 RepID=A0A0L6JX40_9FIRM|nr:hypothetical protein [Pseudobacteroides cellulosolvens]KNY30418.1 hypothetical protein Bccel_5698 [Pseudobacteroides cellulosolvens ATCC 35603 = DSM 2933]